MSKPAPEPIPSVLRNIQAVAQLERKPLEERNLVQRITDGITRAAGSPQFVVVHVVIFVLWLWLNGRAARPLDTYPFALLNLAVALEAIFLTSFVLMTQDRMARQADKRAHLDLQVNLLAEEELTTILRMLDALCRKAGVQVQVRHDRVAALLQDTNIGTLADALEQTMNRSTVDERDKS